MQGNLPFHLDPAHLKVIRGMSNGGRVLEIGCGGGQNRAFFQSEGFEYVGVDISKTRVFEWLQRFGGPTYVCDAHFLPFKGEQFDVVYCAAVFEHLACPTQAAHEVFRVLKPGGVFLGNVSFLEPWHDESFFHMTPLGAIELLRRTHFEIDHVWPGRNYTGYRAMAAMGSRSTKALRLLGLALQSVYRLEHRLKGILRRTSTDATADIRSRCKVAGAIDWIAHTPSRTNSQVSATD